MAQQTIAVAQTKQQPRALLHRIFLVNSLSSGATGAAMVLASGPIAVFMGVANPGALLILGVIFLVFAAGVYHVASRDVINRRAAWLIFELDVIWIIGSGFVLLTDAFGLSTEGRWLVLIVADLVTVFAIVEFIGLRRLR